jgi:2-methylcitrate dehydratase PrpD
MALASRPGGSLVNSGWHPTPLFGYLGAALMAGMMMQLDEAKMVHALGIAYHQCAGNSQCVTDGALTKRMGPGLAARGGITAALMAGRGITGARNVLEGEYGLFRQYHGGDYDRDILLADLGRRFEGMNIGFKPYPCCGFSHPFIDGALALRSEYKIDVAQIQNVTACGGETAYAICVPPEVKCAPRNTVDAQFSLPWAVATALVKGRVTPADFTAESIRRKDVLGIARKVKGVLEPAYNRHGVGPGRIEIVMADGTVYTKEVTHCLGSIERPMTFNDIADKFRECAAGGRKPLPLKTVGQVIVSVANLESLPDATGIIRLLA